MIHLCLYIPSNEDVEVMISNEDYSKAVNGLRELLYSVCDHAHDRCVKVVVARAKVRCSSLNSLPKHKFLDLSRLKAFAVDKINAT